MSVRDKWAISVEGAKNKNPPSKCKLTFNCQSCKEINLSQASGTNGLISFGVLQYRRQNFYVARMQISKMKHDV